MTMEKFALLPADMSRSFRADNLDDMRRLVWYRATPVNDPGSWGARATCIAKYTDQMIQSLATPPLGAFLQLHGEFTSQGIVAAAFQLLRSDRHCPFFMPAVEYPDFSRGYVCSFLSIAHLNGLVSEMIEHGRYLAGGGTMLDAFIMPKERLLEAMKWDKAKVAGCRSLLQSSAFVLIPNNDFEVLLIGAQPDRVDDLSKMPWNEFPPST